MRQLIETLQIEVSLETDPDPDPDILWFVDALAAEFIYAVEATIVLFIVHSIAETYLPKGDGAADLAKGLAKRPDRIESIFLRQSLLVSRPGEAAAEVAIGSAIEQYCPRPSPDATAAELFRWSRRVLDLVEELSKPLQSPRRGPPVRNLTLMRFFFLLRTIAQDHGADLRLPSHEHADDHSEKTPLFEFAKAALYHACYRGKRLVSRKTYLSESERRAAISEFNHFEGLSDRSLVNVMERSRHLFQA